MARIAFATDKSFPNLTDGDTLAADVLRGRSQQVDGCCWDDPEVDWTAYDLVVLRSTWDYHLRAAEFVAWLDRLDAAKVQVANPTDVLRWNMDKIYLSDLQEAGVAVLPSVWLPQGAQVDLSALLAEKNWQEGVIKPMVSAAAHETLRVDPSTAVELQPRFAEMLRAGGVIVQSFASEIQSQGEWSLLFFDRQFSHAVIKQPQAGDFRVQRDFGGRAAAAEAPAALVGQAAAVLEAIEADLLYARVDAIERQGKLLLMELELIEPYLFLELDPGAAVRLVDAVVTRLDGSD
ncbi:MAG: hypothetical protein KIS80_00840 [Anaerolineales bacterium]|nr:hypothetical protein [Anaerolineales bacterium]